MGKRNAALAKMAFMLAGTALATGCQSLAGMTARAAPFGGKGDSNCYSTSLSYVDRDFSTLEPGQLMAIARDCTDAANATDSIRQRTTALYHSGRANLWLGKYYQDRKQEPPSGFGLATAADQLDMVVRTTVYTGPAPVDEKKKKPAPVGFDVAGNARLELSRVYRMQGRYPEAIATLENMIKSAPKDPSAAARFELARVYLERSRDGAVSDGSLEKAVGYLEVFASDLKGEDPVLVAAGRDALIDRASQLGIALMSGPPSRESSQRAIDAFSKAEAGAIAAGDTVPREKVAAIHSKLGQAKLRMAGLPMIEAPAVFECAAQADRSWLDQAAASFNTALAKVETAEANAGMGCAQEAIAYQGNQPPANATHWYERASALAPTELRYMLSYAGALGATGGDAQPVFQRALSLANGDNSKTALIQSEIARIHLQRGELPLAEASARAAIAADKTSGAAHLMLGKAYFDDRDGKPAKAVLAKAELSQAVTLTRLRADQKSLYADALYHRSLLSMEPPTQDRTVAVRDAIDAVNTIEKPEYKEQACLANVRFMDSYLVADGKIRCSAEESPDPNEAAKGLLMQGMFYLSTTRVGGLDRDLGWERALNSFDKALLTLGDASPGEDIPTKRLRAKLTVGQAISYGCVGLREKSRGIVSAMDATYQAEADKYFSYYRVKTC